MVQTVRKSLLSSEKPKQNSGLAPKYLCDPKQMKYEQIKHQRILVYFFYKKNDQKFIGIFIHKKIP